MARKRWTAQTEITDSLLRLREKRKWQLSFRRYVLEKTPSEAYAPYFGLDIELLREWFALQFTEDMNWDNFGKLWQFEHIVPTSYFNFADEEDLLLCWNFTNLRVEYAEKEPTRSDLLMAKHYFEELFGKSGYRICQLMLQKIAQIELSNRKSYPALEQFLINNSKNLQGIASLDAETFNRLNKGNTVEELLLEREILRKFGSAQKP